MNHEDAVVPGAASMARGVGVRGASRATVKMSASSGVSICRDGAVSHGGAAYRAVVIAFPPDNPPPA